MTAEIRLYQRPQWIFFDLDDTLWDFASHSLESLAFIYENFPEPAQRFSTFEEFRDTYHSHNSLLWQLHAAGKISSEFLRSERWRATLFPEAEPTSPPKACATIDSAYLEFLAKHPGTLKGGRQIAALSFSRLYAGSAVKRLFRHPICQGLQFRTLEKINKNYHQ